jgi:hypothetical protein
MKSFKMTTFVHTAIKFYGLASNLRTESGIAWCILVVSLFLTAGITGAQAQTESWNHTPVYASDWKTGSNWTPAGAPNVGTTADISNGGTSIVTANGDVAEAVTVGSDSVLDIESGSLTVNGGTGTVTVSGGNLQMEGGTLEAGTIAQRVRNFEEKGSLLKPSPPNAGKRAMETI